MFNILNESHISIDIETLSLRLDAKIIQIGAYIIHSDGTSNSFSIPVNTSDQSSRFEDEETLSWWKKQAVETKNQVLQASKSEKSFSLYDSLILLNKWILDNTKNKNFSVWGNGSNFDIALLEMAYSTYNINNGKPLWHFRKVRDQRTLASIAESFGINISYNIVERNGNLHNAASDAEFQMKYIIHLLKMLSIKK